MDSDEFEIVDNFVTANLLVTTTKDDLKEARAAHRKAIKDAAVAALNYKKLVEKRNSQKKDPACEGGVNQLLGVQRANTRSRDYHNFPH